MAKKSNRKLVTPPAEGTIPTEKIDEAVDDVLKKESAKKRRAKKQPAKKSPCCQHEWKMIGAPIVSNKGDVIVVIACEKCKKPTICSGVLTGCVLSKTEQSLLKDFRGSVIIP